MVEGIHLESGEMSKVKDELIEMAKGLPDECTWDDVMYQIYVRQKIEEGARDIAEGRVYSHEEVFDEFGE